MNRSGILINKCFHKKTLDTKRHFCTTDVKNPLSLEKHIKVGKLEITAPLVLGGYCKDSSTLLLKSTSIGTTPTYRNFEQVVNSGINLFDCGEKHAAMNMFNSFRAAYANTHPNAKIYTSMTYLPLLWDVNDSKAPAFVLQENLKRLDSKSFDIFHIHNTTGSPLTAWAHALADAHDAGEVKEIGVSGFSAEDIVSFHKILKRRGLQLASCRVEFNLVRTNAIKSGIFDVCRDLGITIFAANPLATGMLTGKYTEEEPPELLQRLGKTFAVTGSVLDLLKDIGSNHNKTPAQVALNWVVCHNAIPIMPFKHHTLDRDLNSFGWRLSEAEIKALDKASIHGPSILDVFGI